MRITRKLPIKVKENPKLINYPMNFEDFSIDFENSIIYVGKGIKIPLKISETKMKYLKKEIDRIGKPISLRVVPNIKKGKQQ
jgi:3-isopropylmalate dehydratase small subunit